MFITIPQAQIIVPPQWLPKGGSGYSAISITNQTPWFLVTFKNHHEDASILETMLVAWEEPLCGILDELNGYDVVSVSQMTSFLENRCEWTMRRVTEIWRAAESEVSETGPLIYAFQQNGDLYDWTERKVSRDLNGRKCVFHTRPLKQ
jgi:hypothetical protein